MGAKGKANPNWKGGISPVNQKARGMKRYDKWRYKIFLRDSFSCQKCHRSGIRLNAHHIKPFATFPKLRFRSNNGITLCVDCHKLTDTYKTNRSLVVSAINP
jgi:5-methylcytosine-specific restriction endonuclease McrA